MKIARDSLETTALGFQVERPIGNPFAITSDTNKLEIADVFPHAVWRDTNTTFTILLKGVTDTNEITGVTIAGVDCPITTRYVFGEDERTIETITKATGDAISTSSSTNSAFVLKGVAFNATFPDIFDTTTNATNTVEFVVSTIKDRPITKAFVLPLQGKIAPEAIATVSRDTSGKVLGLDIKPGQQLTEQQLLNAVEEILKKSEPPPKTVNIVK